MDRRGRGTQNICRNLGQDGFDDHADATKNQKGGAGNEKLKEALQDAVKRIESLESEKASQSQHRRPRQEIGTHAGWGPNSTEQSRCEQEKSLTTTVGEDGQDALNPACHVKNEAMVTRPQKRDERLNCTDAAKLNRPGNGNLPLELIEKIKVSQRLTDSQNIRVRNEPEPIAVYFKNFTRGPLGILRKALRECVPECTTFGVCFVGGFTLEIITDARQENCLTLTLKIMGITEVSNFDVFKGAKNNGVASNEDDQLVQHQGS